MIAKVKLARKEEVAKDTMAFYFEKPAGFEFRAGQFGDLTIIDPPETDAEGTIRGFSIVTAPYEDYIGFTTRLRDTAFKRILRNLPIGTEVELDAPYGDFTLHKTETTPAVFIIGGIGVTPVHSMITQATHDKTKHQIILFHANRTLSDAPFSSDFERLAKENSNFTYVPVITDEPPEEWTGERGRVVEATINRHASDVNAPIYYLAGPEGMVKAMRQLLVSMDVNVDNIRTEEFAGY